MTVPRYRENPLIIPFSMLCPGISQNTKLHHLTLYKGQVWGEKSYLELCNHNRLNVVYGRSANGWDWPFEQNGELFAPPIPGKGFTRDATQIPWDGEIMQSFTELTNITSMTFQSIAFYEDSLEDVRYQIKVGSYVSVNLDGNHEQCVPPYTYYPYYIWTKEGLKILIIVFRFKNIDFHNFHILNPTPSIHHWDLE